MTVLDERTLELELWEPRNYFLYLLAGPWTFPWPKHRCEALGDAWREPAGLVGNGPFVLSEFERERALLVSSPTWRGSRGNVGRVEVSFNAKLEDRTQSLAGRHDRHCRGARQTPRGRAGHHRRNP